MPKVTVPISEEALAAYEQYAQAHGIPLEEVLQRVLDNGIGLGKSGWLDDLFRLMDQHAGHSGGWRWNREELYDV